MGKEDPQYFKGKLNFDNITDEEIRKTCASDEEVEGVKKFYEKLNGKTLLLSLWDYDGREDYHLSGWDKETDTTMMEAFFTFESAFGISYTKEHFEKVWKDEEYDCGGSIVFPKECVEVIKELK